MKDKQARALAIVALVFMGIFVVTLIMTLADSTLMHGSIGFFALGAGVFALIIFIALKADGRGYSITKINNEIEMQKIEQALKEQEEKEQAEKAQEEKAREGAEENADKGDEDTVTPETEPEENED